MVRAVEIEDGATVDRQGSAEEAPRTVGLGAVRCVAEVQEQPLTGMGREERVLAPSQGEAQPRGDGGLVRRTEDVHDRQRRAGRRGLRHRVDAPPRVGLEPADRIGVPIINASHPPVRDHVVLASMSISWDRVGYNAGVRVAAILDGAKPADLSNHRPGLDDHAALISSRRMAQKGMTLPEALADCDCVVD